MAKTVVFPDEQFTTLSNMLQLIIVGGMGFNATGGAVPTKDDLRPVWETMIATVLGPMVIPPDVRFSKGDLLIAYKAGIMMMINRQFENNELTNVITGEMAKRLKDSLERDFNEWFAAVQHLLSK